MSVSRSLENFLNSLTEFYAIELVILFVESLFNIFKQFSLNGLVI